MEMGLEKKSETVPPLDVARALERWFEDGGKDYPWRRTRDPYAILVSEVMLQQTQIATVLERGYYTRWLERFPDFATLAAAGEAEVLAAWEGLGYYRRARNLQKLAQVVMEEHGGTFPAEPAVMRGLPGIGPYTAGAVSSFAFGLKEPIVDGNVARVLARLFNEARPVDSGEGMAWLWARAAELVAAAQEARVFNSALMELGQTVCRTGTPDCGSCPLRGFCQATGNDPARLPVKQGKVALTEVTERVFFHQTPEGVLLEQETGKRRTGLWKLPGLPEDIARLPAVLLKARYGITRYKVTLWVHAAPEVMPERASARRVPLGELEALPMPSPYRRALNAALRMGEGFALE